MKQCKKCQQELELDNFHSWTTKSGNTQFKAYCKPCSVDISVKWNNEHPDAYKKALNKYYMENPDKFGLTGKPKGRPKSKGMKSGVYIITNTVTGEQYIGCSSDVKRRLWRHLDYNRGRSKQKDLSKAIKQYGREAFTGQVLEYCPKEVMFEKETEYIQIYQPAYNRSKK